MPAGLFHDFLQSWTVRIKIALNDGILPKGYSALIARRAENNNRRQLAATIPINGTRLHKRTDPSQPPVLPCCLSEVRQMSVHASNPDPPDSDWLEIPSAANAMILACCPCGISF
jgi:hypothetical protein